MQSEWQHRLDYLLVLLVVVLTSTLIWRELAPHFYDFGVMVVTRVTDGVTAIQNLVRR
jgi:hypothetical protein